MADTLDEKPVKPDFDKVWRQLRKLCHKRGEISAADVSKFVRSGSCYGLSDVEFIMWAKTRFKIKTTYALSYQLRDILCGKNPRIVKQTYLYDG